MTTEIETLDLKNTSPEITLEKMKENFNYCNWNRNARAHLQHPGCPVNEIKNLSNNQKFIDSIQHKDNSITLITNDKFYIKFSNR